MAFGGEGKPPAEHGFGAMPEAKKQGQCSCEKKGERDHKDCVCKKGGGSCGDNCNCKNK